MKSHPKVLLLCSFSQNTANGITIRNLFKGWPKERIALAEFNDGPDEVCVPGIDHYYFLGNKEVQFIAPFHLLREIGDSKILRDGGWRIHASPLAMQDTVADSEGEETGDRGQVSGVRSQGAGSRNQGTGVRWQVPGGSSEGSKQKPASGLAKIKNALKEWLVKVQRWYLQKSGLVLVSRKFRFSPEFDAWVREFEPDIIYASTGDICKLEFIEAACKRYHTRLAIHIFDDYINSKHERTLFPRYWGRRLDTTFRSVCAAADVHLSISEKMAAEYRAKYGPKFHAFHNPIDSSIWLKSGDRSQESGGSGQKIREMERATDHRPPTTGFTFLYAGKVSGDTGQTLREFIDACDALTKAGFPVRLKVHSPYPFEEIERVLGPRAKAVYAGKVSYHELPRAYREADGLLLPMDFHPETVKFIRLSMLTKASEYMISGTPIFIFAPTEIAVAEYLVEHSAAYHCGSSEYLQDSIRRFVNDYGMRQEIAKNAYHWAVKEHLMENVNERLRMLLVTS